MDAPVSKADLAEKYFKEGANCSQAVLAAFADDLGITEEFAMRLASGFGGGIGRMREVCGAFSALVMIDDLRNASGDHTDKASKDERYNRIRALAEEFSAASGGNSGSPVMNAEGHLIGLAFDGNSEAMSGDIDFEENMQRCINLDVRYMLFIIDKFAGAKNLINEMTIVE